MPLHPQAAAILAQHPNPWLDLDAATVALLSRDRGGPPIALQALLWPMIARDFEGGSRHDPQVGGLARPEAIEWLWEQYLGERDGDDPLACPSAAPTLAGLPAAFVVTAEYDVLRDEAEAYAERLAHEGVPVQLRRYDGMAHGFADWGRGTIDAADECFARLAAAFRSALSEGVPA
jgi:acetyl esterase